MEVLQNWWETTKKVGTDPEEFYQIAERYEGLSYPTKYAGVSFMIVGSMFSIVYLIYSLFTQGFSLTSILTSFIQFFLVTGGMAAAGVFYTAVMHVMTLLFGGRNWKESYRIFAFSTGPFSIAGWIPLVNVVMYFYMLYIHFHGLKILQKLSTGKSITVVVLTALISTLLPIIILIAVVGGAIASLFL